MTKPSRYWPQVGFRLEPGLYATLYAHLSSPGLLKLPQGELATFMELAVRNELTRRGVCLNSKSSESSPIPSAPTQQDVSFF